MLFSPNYAEKLDWILNFAKRQYLHMLDLHRFKYAVGNLKFAYRPDINYYRIENLGFSIGGTDKPELSWEFSSLKAANEIVYALEVTAEKPKLKLCKTCLNPFIAVNPKAEFCSKKCGNVMHVRNFRR